MYVAIRSLLFSLILSAGVATVWSQENVSTTMSLEGANVEGSDDTWIAPHISDEMTIDVEQNRQWRLGQSKYPAKPRSMWELGIHSGHFFIDGDVDPEFLSGFGAGVHLRKSLGYVVSIRFDGFYGLTRGLAANPWRYGGVGGGLIESSDDFRGWEAYDPATNEDVDGWYPSYETTYAYGATQLVLNMGNILFHKDRNRWNGYVAVGVGLSYNATKLDLKDASSNPYSKLIEQVEDLGFDSNTRDGRKEIRRFLINQYDGTYETDAFKREGWFKISDDIDLHPIFTGSIGISRKVSKRINVSLEHQMIFSSNDYLDGIRYRTATDLTNTSDIAHYTSLRLGFNIGRFSKRSEPLYWLNPLSPAYRDIAELKMRPQLSLDDSDKDGVIDLLDQEPNTPEGCSVNTKGVTLDSDRDGVADCNDQEPFSPLGYPVDAKGVAQVEEITTLTEKDVITIIENNCELCKNKGYGQVKSDSTYGTIAHTGCGNWFLPMLHYDLDSYGLRPESYAKLHQVATVMKDCPSLCVTAHGYTDVRSSNRYNQMLSYNRANAAVDFLVNNYGIDRSRFRIMYGGEDSPLIPNLKDNHFTSPDEEFMHFINRRVEFRVCDLSDTNMVRPDGPSAGKPTTGSLRPGSKYKQKSLKRSSGY